jgi:hypothetical protein
MLYLSYLSYQNKVVDGAFNLLIEGVLPFNKPNIVDDVTLHEK